MNTRIRKEERAPCSRDSEAEDGVPPRIPIAVRKAQVSKNDDLTPTLGNNPEKLPPTKKVIIDPIVLPQTSNKEDESPTEDFHQRARGGLKSRKEKKFPQPGDTAGGHRQNFKKGGGFRSQHKTEKRPDRFTLLTKTPKEILALEKGKFKIPPPMTIPVEKRNANKFCEFHGEVGHNTDECNHLRKQIEDMLKAGKLSHIIRELKQNSGKEQPKKKGETSGKEKPQAILMIQSWQNAVRQKITQSFSPNLEIEAEVGGHQVHRMCIDGGSSFEILYDQALIIVHRPEIRNQVGPGHNFASMNPAGNKKPLRTNNTFGERWG
ncbi:hypothetical protein Tco_0194102 [Tanacetum coccineum]